MKNLQRFVDAQNDDYEFVVDELAAGHKRGCWMWYVFPQFVGLGSSPDADFYSIKSIDEARRYLQHDLLGSRLRACTRLVIETKSSAIEDIFPWPDCLKFRSCMTLFARATPDNAVFLTALQKYYQGEPDALTLKLLAAADS